ncbi:MAG: tripartite tricarboxylate transporter substrate binding protein [Spirochaetaceae bacterium]
MKKCLLLLLTTIISCGVLFANGAGEEAQFPSKTIELNMSWPPGGSSDTQARVFVEKAEEVFGQSVVIIDKSGAAGTKSVMNTKIAKPDGYTVMWASGGQFTLTPQKIDVDYSIDDFKPVLGVTLEHTLLVTSKDSGINSLADLAKMDTVSFGSPGASSGPGAAIGMLLEQMGVNGDHVPFSGSNESSTAALGGHVDIADSRTTIVGSMKDLKVLCILSSERSALLPGVPTAKELGYDVVLESYNGLYVPKDTPEEIVETLATGFNTLLMDADFKEFIKNSKIDIYGANRKDLEAKVRSEADFFETYFGN